MVQRPGRKGQEDGDRPGEGPFKGDQGEREGREKGPEGAAARQAVALLQQQCNDMGCAPLVAATFNKELAYAYGVLWGNDSLFNGLPFIWGPGLNLHRSAYNGRNGEYYSEDPVLSGYIGLAILRKHSMRAYKESYGGNFHREGWTKRKPVTLQQFSDTVRDFNPYDAAGLRKAFKAIS